MFLFYKPTKPQIRPLIEHLCEVNSYHKSKEKAFFTLLNFLPVEEPQCPANLTCSKEMDRLFQPQASERLFLELQELDRTPLSSYAPLIDPYDPLWQYLP